MELASISNISISLIVVHIAISSAVTAFVTHCKMPLFMKFMWIGFVWMLPFLGVITWLLIQSFEHKFQMDGGYRQELPS